MKKKSPEAIARAGDPILPGVDPSRLGNTMSYIGPLAECVMSAALSAVPDQVRQITE